MFAEHRVIAHTTTTARRSATSEGWTSAPIVPERFNSISTPREGPIVLPELNSLSIPNVDQDTHDDQ